MTSPLIDFIEARLKADQEAAEAAQDLMDAPWQAVPEGPEEENYSGEFRISNGATVAGHVEEAKSLHIARHDPARVLREVEAKRAILTAHSPTWTTVEWNHDQDGTGHANVCNTCGNHDISEWRDWNPEVGEAWMPEGMKPPYTVWPCETVKLLAAIYSDHPDYRKEWAA